MRRKDPELMRRIVNYIDQYYERNAEMPTVREIAAEAKRAVSTTHKYLVAMAEQNMISYVDGVISTERIELMKPVYKQAPIVGSIPCGTPDDREALVEEYLPLSVSVFGSGKAYVLRASGDSMVEAGISDGDLVVIHEQETAELGDVVVALDNNSKNTLKRLCYDDKVKSYYLHPENKAMKDIYVPSLSVQGVATHVIRRLG